MPLTGENEYKYYHNEHPVCPYCDRVIDYDPTGAEFCEGDEFEEECDHCGRKISILVHLELYYTTGYPDDERKE